MVSLGTNRRARGNWERLVQGDDLGSFEAQIELRKFDAGRPTTTREPKERTEVPLAVDAPIGFIRHYGVRAADTARG